MPKRRSPAPRAPKVPARFRALGGVDPRKLPPGSPYPCGDALVGQRARGKRLAGVVQSCAVPPAGARGPHYALGNVVSGSEVGRAWKASAREAEALAARYSGPDFDLRRKRAPKTRAAAPSPAPAASAAPTAPERVLRIRVAKRTARFTFVGAGHWNAAEKAQADAESSLKSTLGQEWRRHVRTNVSKVVGGGAPEESVLLLSSINESIIGEVVRQPVGMALKAIVAGCRKRGWCDRVLSDDGHDILEDVSRLFRVPEMALPLPEGGLPRPAVKRREELPLPLPQGGLRRREVSPEGLEIVRGFDELSRRWGLLPSSVDTKKWVAGLMVIDGDLHVYGDALVAMGVAAALGNLYPPSTIRDVFRSAFNDAARAANLARMGQDDRTPVVVDVKPVPSMRAQPVTRNVRLSFTAHASPVEHFDVRAAQGARLTRATELAAPLPEGGLPRPKAKTRVPEMAGPAFDPRATLRVDADAPVRRLVRVEITTPDLLTLAPRDYIEVNGRRIGIDWHVRWGGDDPAKPLNVATIGPAWFERERGSSEPGMAIADASVKAIERLNKGASVRVVDVTSEYAIIATTAPSAYDSGGAIRIPAPGYQPSKFRGMTGAPTWRVIAIPKDWLQWQINRNSSGSYPTAVVTLGEVNASMVKRREEMPLPLPEGGLSRPKARASEGYSPSAVQEVVRSFFATGPIAPEAITVLDRALNALMLPPRAGDPDSISWTLRDPSAEVPAPVYAARVNALTKRRAVRDGAATRTARAAKTREQKSAAAALGDLIEGTSHRLRTLAIVLPVGVFPSDSDSGEKASPTRRAAPSRAVPAKRREELPIPLPKGGLRRAELPLPLPPGGLPRPMPRRSTVVRREELPLPVPPAFLKDPPPTAASVPVGEAMEAVAEATADGTNWSKYQSAIFKFITVGTGNAVVEAVAGSGKSTTIVEAVKRIPGEKRVLVLAFNVTVRDELKEKFRGFPNVTVRTLNGHAFVAMAEGWKPIVLPEDKSESASAYQDEARFRQILNASKVPPPVRFWKNLSESDQKALGKRGYDQWKYGAEVERWNRDYDKLKNLIELCRGFMALTPAAIQDVQREYGLLLVMPRRRGDGANALPRPWTWFDPRTNTTYDTNTVIQWVQTALKASLVRPVDGRVARFDAVFPTAMLNHIAPQQFDWIFVDETQDMDTAQLTVVQKSIAPGGRVVVVGDSKQAIYGFRGADVHAMARMEQALNAVRLPLSESYRVPKCVETMVRPVVPSFEVPPGTPEGICKTVTARHMIREWRDGDFVISRKNAPLEPLSIMGIQQGKNVIAVGLANIQRVLRGVVRGAMDLNPTNGEEFREALTEYRAEELVRIGKDERRKRARSFREKEDDEINEIINDLPVVRTLNLAVNAVIAMSQRVKGSAEIDQIIASVNYQGRKDEAVPTSMLKGKLALTTVHKIKGAESPRVWVLNDTFAFQGKVDATGKPEIKHGEEMTDNARQEEINLWYVAVTRAKNTRGGPPGELYLVTGLKDVLGEAYVDDDEDEGKAKDA